GLTVARRLAAFHAAHPLLEHAILLPQHPDFLFEAPVARLPDALGGARRRLHGEGHGRLGNDDRRVVVAAEGAEVGPATAAADGAEVRPATAPAARVEVRPAEEAAAAPAATASAPAPPAAA